MKVRRWKRKARRMLIAQLRAKIIQGKTELQILEEMELTEEDYKALTRYMYKEDAVNRFDKPVEQAFIDFCLRQEGCIRDLDALLQRLRDGKNANAAIGAIRAKSDIIDRMISRGQEFGLLQKVPESHQVVAGVAVKELDDKSLRAKVVQELEILRSAMVRFGEVDILDSVPTRIKPIARLKPKGEDGEVIEGTPRFAKGGLSKVAGITAQREQRIRRRKQGSPPPT